MYIYVVVAVVLFLATYIYYIRKGYCDHWTQRGVPYFKGLYGIGCFSDFLTKDRSLFELFDDIYRIYPQAPTVAFATPLAPMLLLKDPVNIQHVLAGDFNNFNHRGMQVNTDIDVLADNLVFMNGVRWKLTRQKFTPLFTSTKLCNMYYIMERSAQDFVQYLKDNKHTDTTYNVLCTFCSGAISASVFGIQPISTMESPFLSMAKKAFIPSTSNNIKFTLANVFPKLFSVLRMTLFTQFEDFFIGSMKKVFHQREEQKTRTHDFADLCLAIKKCGIIKDPITGYEMEPTDELLSAQAFFFFTAGIETSAATMFFTLFELARRPTILKQVQSDIDEAFTRDNGKITYESIIDLEYLDRVMEEALRMYPPLTTLSRRCTHDSILPVGNVHVERDIQLHIPVYSIHYDPKYYPDPEQFDPERFTQEGKESRPHYTYLPFGEENRMCIGIRLARLQVKTGIVHILRHFNLRTDVDVGTKVKAVKSTVTLRPANVDFKFVPRSVI